MEIGVLDMGSNTFHMLVARAEGDRVVKVDGKKRMVRLGEATFSSGRLEGDAWKRGLDAARELVAWGRGHSDDLVAVATSAIREAADGSGFLAEVRRETGIRVDAIHGRKEASLVLCGARAILDGPRGRLCVIDIGGGSAEMAVGDAVRPQFSASLPLGVLRLREEILGADGILRPADVVQVRGRVLRGSSAAASAIRGVSPDRILLSSGTARALTALADRLALPGHVPGRLTRRTVAALVATLLHHPPARIRELGVPPGREDTIAIGAAIVQALFDLLGITEARVASGALRFGVAAREMARIESRRRSQGSRRRAGAP